MFKLVFGTPAEAQALAVRYVLDLRFRGVSIEQRRLRLDALADVTVRAERLAMTTWRLDADRVLATAARTPLRPLRANGGDRRSARFQRCDIPLPRGTVAYFRARLQRDRPDILAAYERGEYRSTRQAAIAAGFLRRPTLARLKPKRASQRKLSKHHASQGGGS